ncbi:putative poxvirus c4 C10 domain protein [Rosellinia necatrix]|uniref:Putative poxvirus c4 C10 domain protein n=1 Tax=Rosellinia necatrix TaxID=77044 RepID=A0A1S8A5T8_ROSNE|nr:putative poxvirus c4 C10 domain protein [Rosellinia necatrix]
MDSATSLGYEPPISPASPEGLAVVVTPIDFTNSPLAEDYSSFFALTIDNLFSPDECAKIQRAAGDDWQSLSKGHAFRECQNILVFSPEWASALYNRIITHLPEEVKALRKGDSLAEHIAGSSCLKASMGAKKAVWRIKEANERLSFLRYQAGHHFRPHCDALYARPGKVERSFLTCQIYLNETSPGTGGEPSGGETRFWASQVGKRHDIPKVEHQKEASFLDIRPKIGRALVFQQRMLWHSGQEVKHGEKLTVRLDLMFERHFERV